MRFLQMKSLPPPKKKETRANAQMFETKDYELVLKYEKKHIKRANQTGMINQHRS